MKPIASFFALALVALLAVALGGALYDKLTAPSFDPVQYAREDAEIARYEAEAARYEAAARRDAALEPVDLLLAAIWRALPLAIAILIVLGAAGWGTAALIRFRHERWPDSRGLLPVLAADQDTARAALGGFHGTAQLAASRQPVPHALTWSPHLNYRGDGRGDVAPALAEPAALGAVPTFAQLLDSGRVGSSSPMLLGFDRTTGAPVEGSWLDLYSTAVGGLSGSGKSWTATFLACQAALHGSRLLILDPHAESDDSLAARLAPMRAQFVCEPATTPAEMLAAVRLAAGELDRRKASHYTRGSAPIVVVCDEFAALQRGELADPLAALVEALGQEGRKLDLFGMVCSQVWSSERAGGTPLRDSLASAYIHRLRPAQARMLSGLTSAELPTDLFSLAPGHAYLVTTGGELRPVIIPEMTPADVARVAALLGGVASAQASAQASARRSVGFRPPARREAHSAPGKPDGSQMEASPAQASSAPVSPEAAQALFLFRRGLDIAQIVKELFGLDSSAGRRYQQASAEVQRLIREALGVRGE